MIKTKIVFVVGSNYVPLYLWECMALISKEMVAVCVSLFIVETGESKTFSFSPIINYVDSKFTNFSKNPLELVDLEKRITAFDTISFATDLSELEGSDWFILENKNQYRADFENLSKNGFLTLDYSYKKLIYDVLFKSQLQLNILKRATNSEKCPIVYSQNLSCEKGIKNNNTKLLFNYATYLLKFLKDDKNTDFNTRLDFNDRVEAKTSTVAFSKYYLKLGYIILKRQIETKRLNWKLAVKHNDKIYMITQPKNSFWADPFVINSGGVLAIYFEELKDNGLGMISCITLDENFEIIEKRSILDTDYHLSFPNVFIKDDNFYMIPESSCMNNLQLYKCDEFPFKWSFHSNLMDEMQLIDAVWVFHDNLYWIFANKLKNYEYDNNERLYLYYSDNLFSKNWTPHISNPIVTNTSSSRNGGNIFKKDGKMYRVSQNCATSYGKNIVINEILELSTTNYKEVIAEEMLPPKKYKGMHTLNYQDDITVLDFLEVN